MRSRACSPPADSRRLGIGVNFCLAIYKIVSGLLGGSIALVAAGAHSLGVAIGGAAGALGASIASRPADPSHPYGYGKALLVCAWFAHSFLVLFGISVVIGSMMGILVGPVSLPARLVGLAGAMVCAASDLHLSDSFECGEARPRPATGVLRTFENRAATLSSVVAVAGIIGALLIHPVIDRIAGAVAGLVLASSSSSRALTAASSLMDRAAGARENAAIERIVRRHEGVREVERVLTRDSGTKYCVELGIQVAPHLSVAQADAIAAAIRADLASATRYELVAILVSPSRPSAVG